MKRKFLSPIHLLILAMSTILPVATLPLANAQAPAVTVNPGTVAAGLGSSFTVTVDLTDVANVVGYDVSLLFNNAALSITSYDFTSASTLFGGLGCAPGCNLGVVSIHSNALGELRTARALLGGNTAQSPGTLMSVTFTVTGSFDSPLTLDSVAIAADVGGSAVPVAVAVNSGNFFLPPNILFAAPNLANCNFSSPECSAVEHVHVNPGHNGMRPVVCNIQLDSAALRSGFGGCEVDVRDPKGVDYIIDSGLVFLFPGQTAQVQAIWDHSGFAATQGSYSVFATSLNCVSNDLSSCSLGSTTVSAVLFKMNP